MKNKMNKKDMEKISGGAGEKNITNGSSTGTTSNGNEYSLKYYEMSGVDIDGNTTIAAASANGTLTECNPKTHTTTVDSSSSESMTVDSN